MAFDLGDPVPLSFQIRDATGTLANATTVTLTVTQPDLTAAGPFTLTPTTTGVYNYDFTPTLVGRHTVRCVATGSNASAFSDAFDVTPGASTSIISLADAKDQLNLDPTSSSNDDTLRLFLNAVTSVIEQQVGSVTSCQHVEVLTADNTMVLSYAPVVSVDSIVPTLPYFSGASFAVANYQLDSAAGILRRLMAWPYDPAYSFQIEHGAYSPAGMQLTVTYTTARATVPAAIQLAARMVLEELWADRRGAMALPASGGDTEGPVPQGYTLNERVLSLLAPFSRGVRPA